MDLYDYKLTSTDWEKAVKELLTISIINKQPSVKNDYAIGGYRFGTISSLQYHKESNISVVSLTTSYKLTKDKFVDLTRALSNCKDDLPNGDPYLFTVSTEALRKVLDKYAINNIPAPLPKAKEYDWSQYKITETQWINICRGLISDYGLTSDLSDVSDISLLGYEFSYDMRLMLTSSEYIGVSFKKSGYLSHEQSSKGKCYVDTGEVIHQIGSIKDSFTSLFVLPEDLDYAIKKELTPSVDDTSYGVKVDPAMPGADHSVTAQGTLVDDICMSDFNVQVASCPSKTSDLDLACKRAFENIEILSPIKTKNEIEPKDKIMSRTNVNVTLIDTSAGILDQDSIICSLGEHAYNGNIAQLQIRLLSHAEYGSKIRESMTKHNAKRESTIDLDIRNRTGNEVKLQPIVLEDDCIFWAIK